MSFKRAFLLAAMAAAAAAPAAHAEDGGWIVRAGATMIDPKDDNLTVPGVGTVLVDDKVGLTFDITKMFTKHWGAELLLAYPFKHDIDLKSPAGRTGPLGATEHLPPTLSLVYQFLPDSRVRPYVAAGLNYTSVFNEEPGNLHLDNSWGPALGGGIDFGINDNLLVNVWAKWVDIDSDARLGAANIGTVEIDPIVYGIGIGYRFGRAAPVVAAVPVAKAEPAPAPAPPPPPPPPAPKDTDGDGVVDGKDACPDTKPGTRVGMYGCDCDVTVQLQFAFNSAELTDADKAQLDQTAENLKRLNWISGVAEGHTDSVGADAYNQKLSEARAKSVVEYLASKGLDASRVNPVGFGESQPVADNATKDGRAQNRRVVLRRTDCDGAK
jgi:outer membrane protein W/outer membrane protein OmpA-like peptidoglycan-associated protein